MYESKEITDTITSRVAQFPRPTRLRARIFLAVVSLWFVIACFFNTAGYDQASCAPHNREPNKIPELDTVLVAGIKSTLGKGEGAFSELEFIIKEYYTNPDDSILEELEKQRMADVSYAPRGVTRKGPRFLQSYCVSPWDKPTIPTGNRWVRFFLFLFLFPLMLYPTFILVSLFCYKHGKLFKLSSFSTVYQSHIIVA